MITLKFLFLKNIYFHEDMNEKHSFLRDTCMLTGGVGKRGRLTVIVRSPVYVPMSIVYDRRPQHGKICPSSHIVNCIRTKPKHIRQIDSPKFASRERLMFSNTMTL